jgi:predicted nucleic acid-binding protein
MDREEERIRCVIDSNILIGALVKDSSYKARILHNGKFLFFFPEYGLLEIEKFRNYICAKREKSLACHSYEYAIKFLLESVTVIPQQLYIDQVAIAYAQMGTIDPKDTPFLALALHLECPIWSDDGHMKRQSLVPCYTTDEILILQRENSK